MLLLLLTLHFAACLFLVGFAAYRMARAVTLLNTFIVIFVSCCCVGVNLFDLFAEFLPPAAYSDVALGRAAIANLIFMLGAAIALAIEAALLKEREKNMIVARILPLQKEARNAVMALSVVVIAFLTIWLLNAGTFSNPFAVYTETAGSGQYYKYRQLVEEDVAVKGRGTWTAKKVALNVSPFLMILLAYLFYKTRNWIYLLLLGAQAFCGIMVAGILAQKSFLLIAVLSPLIAVGIWKVRGYSAAAIIAFLVTGFFLGGTIIFQATLNSTFGFAFGELVTRVFLVPAFTPLFYYEVVPDALPFRGVLESLYIYHVQAPISDYATYDVAFQATGRAYGANANFLAIAYTGTGFFGVFWVSALCLTLIVLLDLLLARLEPTHRLVAVACSGFGFVGITSINFLGALENGFLISTFLFVILCRDSIRREPEVYQSELAVT